MTKDEIDTVKKAFYSGQVIQFEISGTWFQWVEDFGPDFNTRMRWRVKPMPNKSRVENNKFSNSIEFAIWTLAQLNRNVRQVKILCTFYHDSGLVQTVIKGSPEYQRLIYAQDWVHIPSLDMEAK